MAQQHGYKKKQEDQNGVAQFMTKLIGAGISLALVLFAVFVVVPNVTGNLSVNMAMNSPIGVTPDSSWKLEASETKEASFTCKIENRCPQVLSQYKSKKAVTAKQLDAALAGKTKIKGDCKPSEKKVKSLCTASGSNASFEYSAEVSKSGKSYVIDVLVRPTPALAGKAS